MKKYLPIVIFLGITILFFYKFVFEGSLPIPADTIVGLYYPYRDLYASTNPNGVAYKNFLITDPVRQQYPWRELAIAEFKQGQLPLWNPYSFSGTPLLANFQTAAFYPLNIVLFILPFAYGWSLLVFLQPLLAGLGMFYYLRNFRLRFVAAVLGGITYAFCGFNVAWMEWNTVVQTSVWLPLMLLAKEQLLRKKSWQWMVVLVLAEACLLFAGHLQTFFYAWFFSNVYLAVRMFQLYKQEKQHRAWFLSRLKTFSITGVLVLLITSIQWVPTLQFILLSGRSLDQAVWHKAGWFIPWQHLIQFIAPDFFGNPTTLNYWGVWNYGELVGYVGIIPLLFALYALYFRRDKKVLFAGILIVVCLLFALPTPLAQLPFVWQIPFISSAQPTRLLFLIDFGLAFLAACGLDYFITRDKKMYIPLAVLFGILGMLWLFVLGLLPNLGNISPEHIVTAKRNLYVPTIFLFSSLLVIIPGLFRKQKVRQAVVIGLLLLTVLDLFRFFSKFTPFTPTTYLFPQTKVLSFLTSQVRPFRIMSLDSRIMPPNFSTAYRLETVEGYDPLYLQTYGEYMISSERNNADISGPFGFNRIITPHNYVSVQMKLLNIKYLLSLSPVEGLKKVAQEGETQVFENPSVLPRAFFVENVHTVSSPQESMQRLTQIDVSKEAVVETSDRKLSTTRFVPGKILSSSYSENTIEFTTQSNGKSFLVLTDAYYPTWHVIIDGKEGTIYKTDYTFRGVAIPGGKHTVRFSISLF